MAHTRLPFCSPYRLILPLLRQAKTPADAIHKATAIYAWRGFKIRHYALIAFYSLFWPFLFAAAAYKFSRKAGPKVARTTGKGMLRQLSEQFWLALAYSISPAKYYVFELFRDERRRYANDYILRYELKGNFHNMMHDWSVHLSGLPMTKHLLGNKLEFSRICQANGSDAPRILAYMTPDYELIGENYQGEGLPPHDIFIKPAKGKGGRGCEKWTYHLGTYRGPGEISLDEKSLIEHIKTLTAKRGLFLIQECLENHPAMRDLGSSLTSLRINCIRNEKGIFEATNAVLKMSLTGGTGVDNFHQGGAVAKVDIKTGIVSAAADSWLRHPCLWHKVHPATKARIEGRQLPLWPEVTAMVEKTHLLFPDRTLLGFDVAITERGPVIIEGNVQSGCDMIQRTHDLPVGRQRLGQLIAFHAEKTLVLPLPRPKMQWFSPWQQYRRR